MILNANPSAPKLWEDRNGYLYDLIAGKYEIKSLPWKAKSDEIYFIPFITSANKSACRVNDSLDDMMYQRGLMCKTKEQAEELSKLLIKTARQFQGFDEEQEYE